MFLEKKIKPLLAVAEIVRSYFSLLDEIENAKDEIKNLKDARAIAVVKLTDAEEDICEHKKIVDGYRKEAGTIVSNAKKKASEITQKAHDKGIASAENNVAYLQDASDGLKKEMEKLRQDVVDLQNEKSHVIKQYIDEAEKQIDEKIALKKTELSKIEANVKSAGEEYMRRVAKL